MSTPQRVLPPSFVGRPIISKTRICFWSPLPNKLSAHHGNHTAHQEAHQCLASYPTKLPASNSWSDPAFTLLASVRRPSTLQNVFLCTPATYKTSVKTQCTPPGRSISHITTDAPQLSFCSAYPQTHILLFTPEHFLLQTTLSYLFTTLWQTMYPIQLANCTTDRPISSQPWNICHPYCTLHQNPILEKASNCAPRLFP